MKNILTAFLYFSFITSGYSQCEDLAFIKSLFGSSYSKVDQSLDSRGYEFMQIQNSKHIVWFNKDTGKNIIVTFDKDKNVQQVSYQIRSDVECYNDLKNQILSDNYKLDFEELSYLTQISNLGGINYYYQGKTHGALLIKGSLGKGTNYQFILMSLEKYHKELNEARKLSTKSQL